MFKRQKSNFDEYIIQRTGKGENQEMESLMKRAAEMDRTKQNASILSRIQSVI